MKVNWKLIVFAVLMIGVIALRDYALMSGELSPHALVSRHIEQFREGLSPAKTERIKNKYTDPVVKAAQRYEIDPVMLAVTVSAESSWMPGVSGTRDEHGICQLMPGSPFAKGHDISTTQGLLDACASVLRHCRDKCPSLLGAFSCYMTKNGQCVPPTQRAMIGSSRRVRMYKKTYGGN